MAETDETTNPIQIEIESDGPYMVTGNIPLVSKTQIVSEYGEPLTWKKDGEIKTDESYLLCRCGHSSHMPFCDATHFDIQFDGTETAPSSLTADRREAYPGSQNIVIRIDLDLCTESGFCANQKTSIYEMATQSADTQVRAMAIAMIEHCPSGALTYALKEGEQDIEVDLPKQIAVTTEITSQGPIPGPLWVTGGIPIIRSDGKPFEIRNRVALCNCGKSQAKPLCDGSHRSNHTGKGPRTTG
jgi:CDGSH-type Zn-finger protein/ferredoxin